jgi:hypothetical protein
MSKVPVAQAQAVPAQFDIDLQAQLRDLVEFIAAAQIQISTFANPGGGGNAVYLVLPRGYYHSR